MKPAARAFMLPLLLAASSAPAAETTTALPKRSPFESASGPAAPSAAANETIEFAGVSTIGKKTDLIFKNKTSNKTSWITKGETKDGISLLNYDALKDQAVVKIDGVEKVLTLRKAGGGSGAVQPVAAVPTGYNIPAPAPSPSGAAAPVPVPVTVAATPAVPAAPQTEQQKQETEARMLVSDLLEIGMAQRKAYEDAQRKAAEGGTTPTAETPAKQP